MNVDRCLALHHEILQHGWLGSGRSLSSLERNCKTWFNTFGEEAEAIRSDLASDLIKFLEQARFSYDWENEKYVNFFYWVDNLAGPESMFEQEEFFQDHGEKSYLILYAMNTFQSHPCGLIYDQHKHLGIISPTIHVTDEAFEQKVWYPLETVLEFWLGQIRKGRIVALPKASDDRTEPWEFIPHNDTMLKENLHAWDQLVEAIETRMPPTPQAEVPEASEPTHGLVDEAVLQDIKLPKGFAYDFLLRARRPRFRMIAPGLEIPTTSTFPDQPFRSYIVPGSAEIPALLLFRSKSNYTDTMSPYGETATGDPIPEVFPSYPRITTYPAGLYFQPTSSMSSQDEIIFVLPFGIGANGYARKSDGSTFGKREGGEDSHTDLYRPGYQPLEEFGGHSLEDVLKSWRGMVERGEWEIDENGVVGGMDEWKRADTEQGWSGFVISRLEGVWRDKKGYCCVYWWRVRNFK